jgi:histidinol-phosphate aminotransferase
MIIERDDHCLIIDPTFFRFKESSLAAGGKIISLKPRPGDKFKPNSQLIDSIISESKKAVVKLIWICNPNNPTGEVYNPDQIIEVVKKSGSFVVIDEAFYEYYDPENKHSAINLISKYKNLLVLRTLSKAYGLAGIRFGYAIGSKEVIKIIENYRNTLLMTSSVVQKIAKVALEDQAYLKKTVMQTRALRIDLFACISKIKNIELGGLSKTNIYLLKHKYKNLYEELLKRNILTSNFNEVDGIKNRGYVKVTVAKEKENKKLIKILGGL